MSEILSREQLMYGEKTPYPVERIEKAALHYMDKCERLEHNIAVDKQTISGLESIIIKQGTKMGYLEDKIVQHEAVLRQATEALTEVSTRLPKGLTVRTYVVELAIKAIEGVKNDA